MAPTPAYRTPATTPAEPYRLYGANAAAVDFYAQLLPGRRPTLAYLKQRGTSDAASASAPFQLGYAPATGRTLVDHLRSLAETAGRRLGLTEGEIVREVIEYAFPTEVAELYPSEELPGPRSPPTPTAKPSPEPAPEPDPGLVTCAYASQKGQRRQQADAYAEHTNSATGRLAPQ